MMSGSLLREISFRRSPPPVFRDESKGCRPSQRRCHPAPVHAYAAKGQYAEAIGAYQRQISLEGETTSTLCYLGDAYAKSGQRDEALAVLNKLLTTTEYVSPAELAILYIGLGDREAAFGSLERAYAARDLQLQYLKVDASFDPLRTDPRFQDLVRRVGLPQ